MFEITAKVDTRGAQRKLSAVRKFASTTFFSVLRRHATIAARYAAQCTSPFERVGSPQVNGIQARDMGRGAVRKSIGDSYDAATSVFAELRDTIGGQVGLSMAKAFYAAILKGDYNAAREILRRARLDSNRIVGAWDRGRYWQANRKNNWPRPMVVGDSRAYAEFVAEQESRVGVAKAGWIAAGKRAKETQSGNSRRVSVTNLVRMARSDFDTVAFEKAIAMLRRAVIAEMKFELAKLKTKKP